MDPNRIVNGIVNGIVSVSGSGGKQEGVSRQKNTRFERLQLELLPRLPCLVVVQTKTSVLLVQGRAD
jgi:hypothetical protein